MKLWKNVETDFPDLKKDKIVLNSITFILII